MIVTFLLIVAFIRSKPWRRERQAVVNLSPQNNTNQVESTIITTHVTNTATNSAISMPSINNSTLAVSSVSLQRRRSLKTHEVTFSGSVVGGSTDSETTADKPMLETLTTQSRVSPASSLMSNRPSSPESASSSSLLYRSFTSSVSVTNVNSTENCDNVLAETSRRLLRKKRIFPRFNTVDVNMEDPPHMDAQDTEEGDVEADIEIEDDSYDRDTEEFYSHIQDATGTTSGNRSKRSSLFSRSDSSATTTSSSGTFTGKRRSAASIISSSICSDVIPLDRRRSSTTTDYSVRSGSQSQRRSSGRVRRYISRMTIAGARRRTTGRY